RLGQCICATSLPTPPVSWAPWTSRHPFPDSVQRHRPASHDCYLYAVYGVGATPVSYNRLEQLSGWILPSLMIRAFGAHCQQRTYPPQQTTYRSSDNFNTRFL